MYFCQTSHEIHNGNIKSSRKNMRSHSFESSVSTLKTKFDLLLELLRLTFGSHKKTDSLKVHELNFSTQKIEQSTLDFLLTILNLQPLSINREITGSNPAKHIFSHPGIRTCFSQHHVEC